MLSFIFTYTVENVLLLLYSFFRCLKARKEKKDKIHKEKKKRKPEDEDIRAEAR